MEGNKDVVLPYRTTGEEVTRFLEARARGRDLSQIQALDFSTGAFQGTLVAASVLGFLDSESRDLTSRGRDYVLAGQPERVTMMRDAVRGFEPYGLLLEAVFDRGRPKETTLDWVVTWWATQGYGNSETNRDEGASAFGRLVEFARLGTYVPGRRGHPTRIRWSEDAAREGEPEALSSAVQAAPEVRPETLRVAAPPPVRSTAREPVPTATPPAPAAAPPVGAPEPEPNSSLVLSLGPGRTVELSIPPQITDAEKRRLLALLELMIMLGRSPACGPPGSSSP